MNKASWCVVGLIVVILIMCISVKSTPEPSPNIQLPPQTFPLTVHQVIDNNTVEGTFPILLGFSYTGRIKARHTNNFTKSHLEKLVKLYPFYLTVSQPDKDSTGCVLGEFYYDLDGKLIILSKGE